MASHLTRTTGSEAYRTGGLVLFAAAATLLVAFGFEHIGGYRPCELCLLQRWPYYIAIPLSFGGLALVSAGKPRLAGLVFFAVALAFLTNAGIGAYQAGAEWKFWPGPTTCSGEQVITGNAGNLLEALKTTSVVRCDEPQLRIFGLSFAGWNVLISLALLAAGLKAAFAAADER